MFPRSILRRHEKLNLTLHVAHRHHLAHYTVTIFGRGISKLAKRDSLLGDVFQRLDDEIVGKNHIFNFVRLQFNVDSLQL